MDGPGVAGVASEIVAFAEKCPKYWDKLINEQAQAVARPADWWPL